MDERKKKKEKLIKQERNANTRGKKKGESQSERDLKNEGNEGR